MESIIKDIKLIIEDIADLPEDKISSDSSMIEDLDLSSLEIMGIISEIESKYSIELSEEEMLSISTVNDIAVIIDSRRK